MQFDFAAPQDAAGILKIMEEDTAPGGLKLLYTRRNDPCASFLRENREAKVGVIRKDGEVIATIAAIPRLMYIEGKPRRVCYVTNMKRLKGADVTINWYEAFEKMCREVNCKLYFCSLITGNDGVADMLHKKRRFMPYAEEMTGYKTYIISTGVRVRTENREDAGETEFVRAGAEDEAGIVSFLNETGRHRNLFPVFNRLSDIGDIKAEDFFMLKKKGKITAVGALWNRREVKQYVLKKCSGVYAWLRRFNGLLSKIGYITLPDDGEEADFAFISFLLALDDDEASYRQLLNGMISSEKDHSMLVLGTDINNPKYGILEGIRAVSFTSELNEIIMTNIDGREPEYFNRTNVELECALL